MSAITKNSLQLIKLEGREKCQTLIWKLLWDYGHSYPCLACCFQWK